LPAAFVSKQRKYSVIGLVFSIPLHRPTPNIAQSWNASPTDRLPIVRYDSKAGEARLGRDALGPDGF
jgi:hypothetical protein